MDQQNKSSMNEFPSSGIVSQEEQEVAQVLSSLKSTIGQQQQNASQVMIPTPPLSHCASSEHLQQQPLSTSQQQQEVSNRGFIARVVDLPVVNSTIRTLGEVYEHGKNRSSFVKYSAETVESSVKTIYDHTMQPVLNRVNSALQLDEFACRQLDRLEKNYPIIKEQPNDWMSADSVKTLRFCLEWLQYATQHIDNQINVLKSGIQQWGTVRSSPETFLSLKQLADQVKIEIVQTLRRVVDVISKYAGHALPIESRRLVRGFILSLPNRWASINQALSISAPNQPLAGHDAEQEAHRVLTLAEESNSMLKNTMSVFHQTTAAAEYWFGRAGSAGSAGSPPTAPPEEPLQETENMKE